MLRIGLFALTGTGNAVLRALAHQGHPPRFVVTRRELGPYPYYPSRALADEAKDLDIPVHFDFSPVEALRQRELDLILSATFHKFIGRPIREKAAHAINLHPSLLPHLKGRNPFYWTIRQGDSKTGLSAHVMEDEMDSGDVIWRQEIDVAADETQGSLRQHLAALAATAAVDVAALIGEGRMKALSTLERPESFSPNPSVQDLELSNANGREDLWRRYRAATPHPGTTLLGRKVVKVRNANPARAKTTQSRVSALSDAEYLIEFLDGSATVEVTPAA